MAEDRLMFPVGFSLDEAVKAAEKDFGSVIDELQKVANRKPLELSVETDLKAINATKGSISALREEMARLSKAWDSMTNLKKFDDNGLTAGAKELVKQYTIATASLEKYGLTLEQIIRQEKQRAAEEQRKAERQIANTKKQIAELDKLIAKERQRVSSVKGVGVGLENSEQEISVVDALNQKYAELKAQLQALSKSSIQIGNTEKIQQLTAELDKLDQVLQRSQSGFADDTQMNRALQGRIDKVAELKKNIQELDAEFARLNATGQAYDKSGTLTQQANAVVERRIALENELQSATKTAAEAQRDLLNQQKQAAREQEIENKRRIQEQERLQRAANERNKAEQSAYNARRKQGLSIQRTLQAEENSIAAINAKLQIQRQRLSEVGMGSAKFNKIAKEVERLSKKLEEANNRVAQLTGQTVAGQRRITSAVEETNRAYSNTEGYISRLLRRTAVLFGIHQVARFAERLRETTAEFELRRVSLGAIIHDTEKANALFSQIKTFAVQSPFEIKDLVGYVKQLSAYRIETDKLFDTTKRLADVSAGLGVDMQRIILAYGQVKAASVLRGTEVRQFTEAGIPLIELLAEKFTALRGEMVSTGEVFDLISQRAVSFEMVAEIFEDMTNAGGMFYNMQEKQAATLAGQWSNLKDSLSIMYDEMGNISSVRGAMEGVINLTKTLADNWQLVGGLIAQTLGSAIILGVFNKFKSLWNMLGTQMLSATQKVAVAQDRYNAAIARQNALLPTATKLERAAASAKVKNTQATLKSAQALEAAAASGNRFTFALKRIVAAIKANWIGLLITAAITAYQVISHLVSKSNELKNALDDIGAEGAKNITVMTRNFELLANKAVQAADGSKAQKDALDELQRTYRDMIPTHLLTIENLRNMAGSYNLLTTAISEYCRQQMLANQIETIIGNTTEKISKAQTKLRDKLKDTYEVITTGYSGDTPTRETISLSFDERSIERAFAGIEKYARTTTDSVQDIIRNAFKDFAGIELTDKEVQAISELGGFANNMHTLVEAYREQEAEIKKITEQQKALTGEVGLYGDLIDAATEKINNFESATLQTGTYAFDTAKAKAAADEYVKVIKKIFQDSGLDFNDMWVDGRFIDIDSINQALINAGNKVSSQANKAFGKIATAYYELVPSDVFSKAINKKFEDVASGMGVSMDLIKKHLKDSNTSIDDYVKNFFNSIEELEKRIKQTQALLQSPTLSESERGKKSSDLENYQQELDVLKALVFFIQLFNVEKSRRGGTGTDDRLSKLKEEVSILEKVYSKYKEYTKYVSQSDAQERINREFGNTLDIFKQYGIELPRTSAEYQAALKKLQNVMRSLPKSQKDVLELGFKIENVDWEDTKSNLEAELKRLADEVSRTKTAKEFFDKMLNLTGDQKLSATVTMSIYGGKGIRKNRSGDDLKRKIIDQIRNAFGTTTGEELDLSLAINYNTLEVDYLKLAQIAEENKDILLEASKATRDGIIKNGLETTAARIMQWEKDIQKEKSFAEKRIQIAQETAQQIIDIERSNLPEKEKERLTTGYKERETEQVGQLMWDNFKNTPLYIKMFDNLETASTTMLNAMREKLKELESQWGKSLNPTELKELQSRMNEIDQQLATKNPFKTLGNAIKEYMTLREQGTRKQAEMQYAADVEANKKAWDELNAATARAEQAKINYGRVKSDPTASGKELFNAIALVYETEKIVKNAEKNVDKTDKNVKKTGKLVSRWKALADAIKDASTAIGAYTEMTTKAGEGIIQMMDAFGASEGDMQFIQDIVGGIGKIGQGAQNAVAGILSGNPLAAITGVVSGLGSIVSGVTNIFYAGRIKRANKEIKKQQKILDALEHSYDRLQKAADQSFGSEFVANIANQRKNLKAQIAATEKQLAAERSKGKKKDDNKIAEYEKKIQSLKDELEDMQSKVAERMLGTDLASAARSFAQAWLEAYKEFGDVRKAIEGEMQKMMENLIVESVLGAVMQKALQPVFDMINDMGESDFYDDSFWKEVVDTMTKSTDNALTGADVIMNKLEAAGVNIRDLGDDFTGISKDIATASEESILGLSSLINTSLYYVSNIDRNVAQITAIMTGGGYELTSGEQLTDLITIQNQHLAYLPNIALNTAQTAERCERAAAACENIAENLNRVIKPNGVQGSYRVNTSI